MMRFLVASNNAHKLRELREIFAAIGSRVELVAPRELGIDLEPDESAGTYADNARLKARAFAQALLARPDAGPLFVIADDSGLEVDALGGAPGIYSSRYHRRAPGGDGCTALLKEMEGVPDARRTARFQCAIVLISPYGDAPNREALDAYEHVFYGTCEGTITHELRGTGGFGFDPVFQLAGDTRTLAELPAQEKHRVSHRGVAARKAMAFVERTAMEPGAER